jgi:outer membrane lipoprotein-sorting protein
MTVFSSPSPSTRRHVFVPLAALLASFACVAEPAAAADSPWASFDKLRASLERGGPQTVRFTQTFLPAGFEQGETETGTLAISLPKCLRWDYGEPFPKSFLLCQDIVYYWNPGETRGHRYPVENEEAPGLDFFLLTTDDLRLRYNATARREGGGLRVQLLPIRPTDDVVSLEVLLDANAARVLRLSYQDSEGNTTRFELSDYRPGAEPGTFVPPAGVEWEEP